ncbi:hypothetical protein HZB01_00895 [Candidatus Woesearchaeota archaeon]|nr:hypothetical protein [Candidatus Woesearchaeota archaeon]
MNIGKGFGVWAEYVWLGGDSSFEKGGLVYTPDLGNGTFFLARVGYGTNNEGLDGTARLIFNRQLTDRFSVGSMVNSGSLAGTHIHAEVPRVQFNLNPNFALYFEGTIDHQPWMPQGNRYAAGGRGGLRVKL